MPSTSTQSISYKPTYRRWNIASSGEASEQGPISQSYTLTDTVTKDGPLPGYRKIIASGGNATTNLSGTRHEVSIEPGFAKVLYVFKSNPNRIHVGYEVSGDIAGQTNPTSEWTFSLNVNTTARNRALVRLYENLSSVETAFKGMVFAGELPELLRLIRSPARSLRQGLDHYLTFLRRNVPRDRRRRPSFVRETWLEYSFGWRPLVRDIDDAIKAFYLSDYVKPIFEMVRGFGSEEALRLSTTVSNGHGTIGWKFHKTEIEEALVKFYGIYRHNSSGIPDSHAYGFRVSEFVPTLWELIPNSFLVDYFTNIGDILTSWSYRNIGLSWLSMGTKVQSTIKLDSMGLTFQEPSSLHKFATRTGHPGSAVLKKRLVTRTRSVPLSVPSFELQVPGNWRQWLNLAALSKNHDLTIRRLSR